MNFDEEGFTEVASGVDKKSISVDSVSPVFQPDEFGNLVETPKSVYSALKKFGYKKFRPGQESAVMRILSGLSTLVILSTGAGKSLCYQLPAYIYAQHYRCITLVISPLVSLMEDQVTGLPACLKAACIHTGLSSVQRKNVFDAIAEGNVHVLLVSPEAAVGGKSGGGGCLPPNMPTVAFACIDEAHCVSEWSHNFRPSYLRLCKVLRRKFGVRCILALTATATERTARSIADHMSIEYDNKSVIRGYRVPDNLVLSVSMDRSKEEALIETLKGERFSKCQSIIVYCTRREQTERLSTLIRTSFQTAQAIYEQQKGKKRRVLSWEAEAYHAGLTSARRRSVQNRFMQGKLRIVVATVAFGMGLDKSDVRGIIHYNMPKSFETYVQEIGRAGRDGLESHCHLFLDPQGSDLNELRRHTYGNSVDRSTVRKLLSCVFVECKCRKLHEETTNLKGTQPNCSTNSRLCPGHEVAVPIDGLVRTLDLKEENIETLLCYLELAPEHWIENLTPVYANCKVQSYGGNSGLRKSARKCPPLAAAIALARQKGIFKDDATNLEFPVVTVASLMGWDSGIVKRELKSLEWNTDFVKVTGKVRRSGLIVEFDDLAFHFRSYGDLTDEELDKVLDFLYGRVVKQERTELSQLRQTYDAFFGVSFSKCWSCMDEPDLEKSSSLKKIIETYFEKSGLDENDLAENSNIDETLIEHSMKKEDNVRSDIRHLVCTHTDHTFNGRSAARILSGIPSPLFPSDVWGRVRRFWRAHIDVDFNMMCKWATEEILRLK